jgi:hypothetical protein
MYIHHFDGEDFAATLLASNVSHSTASEARVTTYTAHYLGRPVILIEYPHKAGGVLIEQTAPEDVGQHEMALDALKRGLIDPPVTAEAGRQDAPVGAGFIALEEVPQTTVDALNCFYIVTDEIWAEELMRTKIIQTDEPAGHALIHTGVRDDGQPIVLIQVDAVFLIVLPWVKE